MVATEDALMKRTIFTAICLMIICTALVVWQGCSSGGGSSKSGGAPTGTGTGTGSNGGGGLISPSTKKPAGTDAAVAKALEFIVNENWPGTSYGYPAGPVTTVSFRGLALLAAGDLPESSKSAADYVAGNIMTSGVQENWFLAIGSIFLAEAYKALGDEKYKTALQSAITKLEKNIEPTGAYSHDPQHSCPLYVELAVVVELAMMAMGAAKECGCTVDQNVLQQASVYLEKCVSSSGGVMYSIEPGNTGKISVQRAGHGIFAFKATGISSDKISLMTGFLKQNFGAVPNGHGSAAMGYLGCALGSICSGQETWDAFVENFFPRILSHQNSDGSFQAFDGDGTPGDSQIGAAYRSAIYTLILQLDLGRLQFLKAR